MGELRGGQLSALNRLCVPSPLVCPVLHMYDSGHKKGGGMTRQTTAPLANLSLSTSDRQISELARSFREAFGIDLNPAYQRGRVWTLDQKIALVRSWMTGTPTGVVILNDRSAPA